MLKLAPWRVIARNSFYESENPIHRDAPARALGFRAGLVAGVTIYGYLTRPAVTLWGRDWLERGTADVRFRSPVFDGDSLEVQGSTEQEGGILASIGSAGSDSAAMATFGLRSIPAEPPVDGYPNLPLPQVRARADADAPATRGALGSFDLQLTPDRCADFLDEVANDLDAFAGAGLAQPAILLDGANLFLMANVELGPWIHTGTSIVHCRPLRVGATLSFRGGIAEVADRKGRPTLTLDIVVGDETGATAALIRHDVIYDATTGAHASEGEQ